MEASKQLKDYVDAVRARDSARKAIDEAKVSGDLDGELRAREQMRDAWTQKQRLRSELSDQYAGNPEQFSVDVQAYHLLTHGSSL
jgi:ribosomal protein L19E